MIFDALVPRKMHEIMQIRPNPQIAKLIFRLQRAILQPTCHFEGKISTFKVF